MIENGALILNFPDGGNVSEFLAALSEHYSGADVNGLSNPLVLQHDMDRGDPEWRRLVDAPGDGMPSLSGIMTTYNPNTIVLFVPNLADPEYKPEAKQATIDELRAYLKTAPDTKIIVYQPEYFLTPEKKQRTQAAIDDMAKRIGAKKPIVWEKSADYADLAYQVGSSFGAAVASDPSQNPWALRTASVTDFRTRAHTPTDGHQKS